MARKKKRQKNKTVFISIEGNRETYFFEYLIELYKPEENGINIYPEQCRGGSPASILNKALLNLHYNKVYAWFDEDTTLEDSENYKIFDKLQSNWNLNSIINKNTLSKDLQETYNTNNRNPILIVSNPLSVEGILIRLLDKNIPSFQQPYLNKSCIEANKKNIKSAVNGFIGASSSKEKELAYYRINLSKKILEEKSNDIFELKLLLSIFKN